LSRYYVAATTHTGMPTAGALLGRRDRPEGCRPHRISA